MRILRIVSAGYEQGGAENGIVLTNKLLQAAGHDVKVISSDVNPTVEHFSDYEFKSVYTTGIHKLTSAAFNYDAYKVTKRVLKEFRPDAVLVHTLSQPTASVLYALKKYPTVLFVHGPEIYTKTLLPWYLKKDDYKGGTFKISDLTFRGRLHYFYFLYVCRPLYQIAMRNVDRIIALSSYTKQMLDHEGISATLLPNGVGLLASAPYLPENHQLLYAGRLEKFKGIDNLINAIPVIKKKFPDIKLRIAGEGEFSAPLKSLVKKLDLGRVVTFTGKLSSEQLEKEYKDCSVFILPSTWPETFGKVGVEAMSVGRPVIATDVGGVKDWLQDGKNGYFVSPHKPGQIADKVIHLFSNPAKARKMAHTAHESAKSFSIAVMSSNIETIIHSVIESTPRPVS